MFVSRRNRLIQINWFNHVKWPVWRMFVRPLCVVLMLCVESRLHAGQCVEQPVGFPALPGQEPFPLQLHRQPSGQHSTQHQRGDFILGFIYLSCQLVFGVWHCLASTVYVCMLFRCTVSYLDHLKGPRPCWRMRQALVNKQGSKFSKLR